MKPCENIVMLLTQVIFSFTITLKGGDGTMNAETVRKYLRIQRLSLEDPVYLEALRQFRTLDEPILNLLRSLPREQLDLLSEYIYQFGALSGMMLEIACKHMEFPRNT